MSGHYAGRWPVGCRPVSVHRSSDMREWKRLHLALGLAVLLLALLLSVISSARAEGEGLRPSAKKGKAPATAFLPGAEVTFNFYFVLPAGYHFGEDPAAAVVFDEEALEGLPVAIDPMQYLWPDSALAPATAGNGMIQSTKAVQVRVRLAADCPLGELEIPVAVDVFFCNDEEGWCTNSHYEAVLSVTVSDSEDCVEQGSLKVCVMARPPEI